MFFKLKIMYLFILLIHVLFSYSNQDSRMIGLAGAYNTIAEGYRCIGINPANLTHSEHLTLNLLNSNFNISNNFITLNRLNNINGANLEDPNSNNYFSKDKILSYLKSENIKYNMVSTFPFPLVNISKDNMAFTSKINFFSTFSCIFAQPSSCCVCSARTKESSSDRNQEKHL